MNTIIEVSHRPFRAPQVWAALNRIFGPVAVVVARQWKRSQRARFERESIRALQSMNSHQLRDIGIHDRAAIREVVKGL